MMASPSHSVVKGFQPRVRIRPRPIRNTKTAPGSTTRAVRNCVMRSAKFPCWGSADAWDAMSGKAMVGPNAAMAPPMCRNRKIEPKSM